MSKQRRRDTTLTIRLTKAEKERIERNAKRAERSITDYLVLLSLETPIHVAEDVKPLLIDLKLQSLWICWIPVLMCRRC